MFSRTLTICVSLFWFISMTWLFYAKIAPSWFIGDPPNYQAMIQARQASPVIGWNMNMNGHDIGWALNSWKILEGGVHEIQSFVRFKEVPLTEITGGIAKPLLREVVKALGTNVSMDLTTVILVDSMGNLMNFRSTVKVHPTMETIKIFGTVKEGKVVLDVTALSVSYTTEFPMPPHALPSDAFSPQMCLPNLRLGQTWSVPTFNPLMPSKNPMEFLRAEVERTEYAPFGDDQFGECFVVTYRTDPGERMSSNAPPRGIVWVRADGTIVKQKVQIFDSVLMFAKMSKIDVEDRWTRFQHEQAK